MKILTRSTHSFWHKAIVKSSQISLSTASSVLAIAVPTKNANRNRRPFGLGLGRRLSDHISERLSALKTNDMLPESFRSLRPSLSYLPSKQIRQVKSAFQFALEAHHGQYRKDGTPYIVHPLATCKILAELKLDVATLMAALLHDVVEDCNVSVPQIAQFFGDKVAQIVTGVTKFKRLNDVDINAEQAENFQKMIIAMASDLRVVLVKLADRLHNMRTLSAKSRLSQIRIAQETMDIYAPIANRMGLEAIYRELQDLAFQFRYPFRARVLQKALLSEFEKREINLFHLRDELIAKLKREGIRADVSARLKNAYSIFCKMRSRQVKFAKVFDICGLRVVIEKDTQCYTCLGLLHELYKPIPGRIKDFIALPKNNGYQSLHTTLVGPGGTPVEIQIRSRLMHDVAESGLAAHWLYKDKSSEMSELEKRAHQWMNSLMELNQTSANAGELLEHVKTDLFNDAVYVFTPKGKIINLPRGATALDFAYSIHTDIGHHARMAIINGEEYSLRTELRNGDRVSIETNPMPTVTVASIAYTKTARARSQIRHYLRHLEKTHLRELGEHWLRQVLTDMALLEDDDLSSLSSEELENKLQATGQCQAGQCDRIFSDIALGEISPMVVALALLKKTGAEHAMPEKFTLRSSHSPAVIFSPCCFPIPDDRIVGFLKKGEGLMVHRQECEHANIGRKKNSRLKKDFALQRISMTWAEKVDGMFVSRMTVKVNHHQGVLADISSIIAAHNCNIVGINMHTTDDKMTYIDLDVLVDHRITLGRLYKKLHAQANVKMVLRWRETSAR